MIPFGFWKANEIKYPLQTDLTACWSLFKRVPDYNGSCITVRRSSDNAEQDIGFTSDGILDVASMESFIGSNTAYVMKWYDQKDGVGTDLVPFYLDIDVQYYPVIILSGTTQIDGSGKITIKWGNSNYSAMFAACNSTRLINAEQGTIYYSYQNIALNTQMGLGGNTNGNSLHTQTNLNDNGVSGVFWSAVEPQQYRMLKNGTKTTIQEQFYVSAGTLYNNYNDQTKLLGAELATGWNTLGTGHSIGGRGDGNGGSYFRGYCNEMLIYGSSIHSMTTVDSILDDLAILNS
jgi:hypothetical protein